MALADPTRRRLLDELFAEDGQTLKALEERLQKERIDVTLPGDPLGPGHLHLLTQTRREIEDIFVGMGYHVVEGPEVETDYYNFTALNIPPGHPARRDHDTFYFSHELLLRTHTSPMQIRVMELHEPPIYYVFTGKTYRRDNDATHTPMFHQCEGLWLGENVSFKDLKVVFTDFCRRFFEADDLVLRFRPSFMLRAVEGAPLSSTSGPDHHCRAIIAVERFPAAICSNAASRRRACVAISVWSA